MQSKPTLCVVGVLAISLGLPAAARAAGDAAAGKALATACQACHVGDTGDTPHLAGQRPTYVAKQLKAFKAGDRKNPLMNAVASVLDDAAIDNLAAFWSSQPAAADTTVPPEVAAIKKSKMTFPREFPKGFTLYASVNKEDQATVAQQWINAAGLQAVKAGKPMPSGTVILVVNYAAKLGPDKKPIPGKDGSWQTDKVKGYEGMEVRTGWGKDIPELIRNVDWNYAIFTADKAPRAEINQAICLACHVPAAKNDFVFSLPKIQAKLGAR
ncbi:MAG TPA: cytochrome P460 family protein [Kofleriaceae bacterium]|nr:cytochrome P460 family protein [Kofleriaceae bacterium]